MLSSFLHLLHDAFLTSCVIHCATEKKKKEKSAFPQGLKYDSIDVFFTLNTIPLAVFPYHVRLLIYLAFYFEKFYYQIEII